MAMKQQQINAALSKLTDKEKELLGLVKKPSKPRTRKSYNFKIKYMIGDADGETFEENKISVNNPFLDIVTNALNKLEPMKNHWGISLNDEQYLANFKSKKLNKLEYNLLRLVNSYDETRAISFFKKFGFEDSDKNREYLEEFEGLLKSDTEYSFLTYKGYKIR